MSCSGSSARDERELTPTADCIFAIDKMAGTVALEMNNIPARVSRALDESARIQTEVDAALSKVSACLRECAESLRAGGEVDPAVDEDDA